MSEPKYAPAPYRVDAETPNHAPIITAADGMGRDIAEIRGDSKEERAATANLLAAAPDLLEACKRMVAITRNADVKELKIAVAAIDKAEGRA